MQGKDEKRQGVKTKEYESWKSRSKNQTDDCVVIQRDSQVEDEEKVKGKIKRLRSRCKKD